VDITSEFYETNIQTLSLNLFSDHIMSNLPLFRDPWAKREAWRKHPVFSNRAMFSGLLPGFGIAVVAFTAYVVADNFYLKTRGGKH